MEHIKIKSLLLVGVITLAASMFAGCTEYADDPAEFTTENIVINYTDSVIDASISSGSRTRSVPVRFVIILHIGRMRIVLL